MKHSLLLISILALLLTACQDKPNTAKQPATANSDSLSSYQALDSITQLIAKEKDKAEHYRLRSAMHLDMGNLNAALADVNKAIQLDSLSTDTWVRLADVYYAKHRHVDSREALLKALKLDSKNTSAMLKLAQLYAINGDIKTALNYAEESINTEPTNAEAHLIKSNLKLHLADTASAIFHLHKATDAQADFYTAWMLLGQLHEEQKKIIALQYYQTALSLDTNNTTTLYSIAMYHQNRNELDLAEQYYIRILSKEKDNPYALYNLGYINMVYKDLYQAAANYFEKAYLAHPKYTDALYNWAYALELSGETQMAIAKYKEVLAEHPKHEMAIERLNELL